MSQSTQAGTLNVLYLDFDGPMHPADVYKRGREIYFDPSIIEHGDHQLFENQFKLLKVLEEFPEVRIVLSTHWVFRLGFNEARARLTPELRKRVIGATYHSSMRQGPYDFSFMMIPRYLQIVGDLSRRRPTNWVAVDDDAVGWPDVAWDKLVYVDEMIGLSDDVKCEELHKHFTNWQKPNILV